MMTIRRHKASVYSRGEETRAKILDTAVQLFGLQGFDSVTTRMIATAAAVPAPSLRYYFESKEGLYLACWNHIQEALLCVMEPALLAAERLLADENAARMQLIDAFCTIQEALVDYMIGGPGAEAIALFVVRHDLPSASGVSQLSSGNAAVAYRMTACFTQLVMRISGRMLEPHLALIVAGLVNGQLTTIYIRRGRLAQMGLELEGERLGWLKRTIRQQTAAVLMLQSG